VSIVYLFVKFMFENQNQNEIKEHKQKKKNCSKKKNE